MKSCGFCGNLEEPGRRLAAGAGGIICQDCVQMFQLALNAPSGGPNQLFCHFCRKASDADGCIWVRDRGHLCQECISAIAAHYSTNQKSQNLKTARRYLRAIEDGVSFDDLASFFTPDVVQHEYPNQFVPQGAQRDIQLLREAGERGRRVVTSQRYDVRNALASGDWVALEVTWTAVLAVPVGSIPASGEMRANFGVFLQFRDGRIARQHNYDCFDPF